MRIYLRYKLFDYLRVFLVILVLLVLLISGLSRGHNPTLLVGFLYLAVLKLFNLIKCRSIEVMHGDVFLPNPFWPFGKLKTSLDKWRVVDEPKGNVRLFYQSYLWSESFTIDEKNFTPENKKKTYRVLQCGWMNSLSKRLFNELLEPSPKLN